MKLSETAFFTFALGAFTAALAIGLNATDCAGREYAANVTGEACDFITGNARSFTPDVRIPRHIANRAWKAAEARGARLTLSLGH